MQQSIARKIKSIMYHKNLNQHEFAYKVGKPDSYISTKLNSPQEVWKVSELNNIANVLNCDLQVSFIDRETGRVM